MKHLTLFVIFYCFTTIVCGQFSYDFSQKNYGQWFGDTSKFIINTNHQLQLHDTISGQSVLFHKIGKIKDTLLWQFYFKLDFAPSLTNTLKIYLSLDTTAINAEGYSLEIGENGNNDSWKLYRLNSSKKINLISGENGLFANQPAEGNFTIQRYPNGLFQILVNTRHKTDSISYVDTIPWNGATKYFAIACDYTETRKDKFYFDDIYVNSSFTDNTSPEIDSISIISKNELRIYFSEKMKPELVENANHYFIKQLGYAQTVFQDSLDQSYIVQFMGNFMLDSTYSLNCINLQDLSGNILFPDEWILHYENYPTPYNNELLITEVMADPTPAIGLPEFEYIEIYNNSQETKNLQSCRLTDGSTTISFEKYFLKKGEYLILCSKTAEKNFSSYGKIMAFATFPSLNNSGDFLQIINANGVVIHELNYSDAFYEDVEKKEGGYSLELINPKEICRPFKNWIASKHPLGGTPGSVNSFWTVEKSKTDVQLLEAKALNEWEIKIDFDGIISSALKPNEFAISPKRSIATAELEYPNHQKIILVLDEPLLKGQLYSLIWKEAKNCVGKEIPFGEQKIFLPERPDSGDLIINEILFNPYPNGSDFIELYNTSSKYITCDQLYLKNSLWKDLWLPLPKNLVIKPNDFIVLTPDKESVIEFYANSNVKNFYSMILPSLADEEGIVLLGELNNNTIRLFDSLPYKSNWHNPLLQSNEGVSLERISSKVASYVSYNWQSSSSQHEYATPAYINSQSIKTDTGMVDAIYQIESKTISPNQDNLHDYLKLLIHHQGGSLLYLYVYDLDGNKLVTHKAELLSDEHIVSWGALDNEAHLLPVGNYILVMEFINPKGKTKIYKESLGIIY